MADKGFPAPKGWLCELTHEEGAELLLLLDEHLQKHGGYQSDCHLCRARSRISLARDFGPEGSLADYALAQRRDVAKFIFQGLRAGCTAEEISAAIAEGLTDEGRVGNNWIGIHQRR